MTHGDFMKLRVGDRVRVIALDIILRVDSINLFYGTLLTEPLSPEQCTKVGVLYSPMANLILMPKEVELVPDGFVIEVKKKDKEFPHLCPKCKGPAYVGFNVKVDCKWRCIGSRG